VPHLPVDALAGKIVIDANNYYRLRDGIIAELLTDSLTAGELFQRHLPGARTVKTFNTLYFEHLIALARPAGSPDRSALPIAGDDDAAKESVAALLDRLGYDTVDAGATTESRRIQEGSPAYVLPYLSDPRLPWPRDPGKPADAKEIRTALEQARSRS
jgi:8-hydroxy-5-deazaflavin:NADPH oxidoreductase